MKQLWYLWREERLLSTTSSLFWQKNVMVGWLHMREMKVKIGNGFQQWCCSAHSHRFPKKNVYFTCLHIKEKYPEKNTTVIEMNIQFQKWGIGDIGSPLFLLYFFPWLWIAQKSRQIYRSPSLSLPPIFFCPDSLPTYPLYEPSSSSFQSHAIGRWMHF